MASITFLLPILRPVDKCHANDSQTDPWQHRRHTVTDDGLAIGSVTSSPLRRSESYTTMKKARPQWLMDAYRRFRASGPIVIHGPAQLQKSSSCK